MRKSLVLAGLTMSAAVFAADIAANGKNTSEAPKANSGCGACCKKDKCADAQKYISRDAAINVALAHAGLERSKVRDIQCELDRENGIMVYEVEFESGLFDYEYDIDAITGKVLKSKKEFD